MSKSESQQAKSGKKMTKQKTTTKPKAASQGAKDFFGVQVLSTRHTDIKKIKDNSPEPEIHGNKIWKASTLLVDFLEVDPPKKDMHVMDLGCGWGLSSIYCAQKHKTRVTSVDADKHVFPYLELHEKLNGVKLKKKIKRFEKLTSKDLSKIDEVIGSDICFWDELRDTLFEFVKRAFDAGVQRIVLADPGRSPFLELVDKVDELYETDLYEWDTKKPVKADGYVVEIFNQPKSKKKQKNLKSA
jgi:predicted nicotinamide N-methyase